MLRTFLLLPTMALIATAMPQNYDQILAISTNLSDQKNEIIKSTRQNLADSQADKLQSLTSVLRTFGREEARKETETKLSQLDSLYANLQKKTNNIVNAKPIVDSISEKDKYGNDGGINRVASIAIVNFYENIANFVNAIFEVPSEKMQSATLKVGEVLRFAGRSLVGL